MVFEHVYMVVGVIVSLKTAKRLMGMRRRDPNYNDAFYVGEFKSSLYTYNGTSLKLFQFPCCSDSNQTCFILGKKVKSWVRFITTCPKCEEYSLCDDCIGQTEFGYYDVQKILDGPVECPIENTCMYCWRDNRKPITNKCVACGHKPNWQMRFNWPQENKFEHQPIVEALEAFMEDKKIEGEVKIYYMLDDCLSCT